MLLLESIPNFRNVRGFISGMTLKQSNLPKSSVHTRRNRRIQDIVQILHPIIQWLVMITRCNNKVLCSSLLWLIVSSILQVSILNHLVTIFCSKRNKDIITSHYFVKGNSLIEYSGVISLSHALLNLITFSEL